MTTEQEAIYIKPLMINATIEGMSVRVFINLGYQSNYVSSTFFRKIKLPLKIKQNLYSFYTFDNQSILVNKGKIDKETRSVSVNVSVIVLAEL